MSQLFSAIWMNDLKDAWNHDTGVYAPLEKDNFSANITYGFKGEEAAARSRELSSDDSKFSIKPPFSAAF